MRAPLLGAALLLPPSSARPPQPPVAGPLGPHPEVRDRAALLHRPQGGKPHHAALRGHGRRAWDDVTVPLTPPALQKAEADRVEILLPATAGHAKPTLVAFVRTKRRIPTPARRAR